MMELPPIVEIPADASLLTAWSARNRRKAEALLKRYCMHWSLRKDKAAAAQELARLIENARTLMKTILAEYTGWKESGAIK